MNLTLKISKLSCRYLAVICGGVAAVALLAATGKTPLAHLDLSGALLFLLFNAFLGLALWGMLASSDLPKSKHFSGRLADAGPSFTGVFFLVGGLFYAL